MSERDNKLEELISEMYVDKDVQAEDNNWSDDDEKEYNAPIITNPELVSGGDELVADLNMGDNRDEININIMDPVHVNLQKNTITFEFDTGRGNVESAGNPTEENVDLSTAKFKKGDVFTAEQLQDDYDAVIVGVEENEDGDGVSYMFQALGAEGFSKDEKDIQGEPSHSLF